MIVNNITETKAQLSALIARVEQGEEVIIGKAGKPIAKLIPYDPTVETRKPGILKGQIKIAEDFDSLPDDIAKAFGME